MQRLLVPARTLLRHRDLVVALLCSLLLGLAYSFIVPFLSLFGTVEVGMRPMVFSVFMAATSLAAVVASTVLARWSDTHLSRRTVLILGCIAGALGYLGYAFVRDVVWLTVIGSTFLAVAAITFSQLFAYAREQLVRSNIPRAELPLYMNVFRLFFALAWTLGPAAASWIMIAFSYEGIFVAAAAVFVVLLLVVLRFVPAAPPPAAVDAAARIPLLETLRRPDILAVFSGFVLVFAAAILCMLALPLFVIQTLGGTERHVGIIYSLGPVFELPLMLYFGVAASRGNQERIIRVGVALAVAYYGALMFVRAPWHIYPLQILSAATIAVTAGVAITYFQNYLPSQPGTATNLYSSAQRFGSMAGYLVFGFLSTAVGLRGIFALCTGLCLVTLALFTYLAASARRRGPVPSPQLESAAGGPAPASSDKRI